MKPRAASPAFAELAVVTVFVALVAVQWQGYGSVAGTDAIAYITAGMNLASRGTFTNSSGQPELWFPPFYPLLIGALSAGGAIDPTAVARLVSASFAVIGLLLAGRITRLMGARPYEPALAMAILAANPIYQDAALFPLSEATATTLALGAFAIWLRLPEPGSSGRVIALGALIGLSYLTRPEGLLLLPLWAVIDAFRSGITAAIVKRYAIAAAAALLVALPYLLYLHQETGGVTFTGKTAVNLASGRATYTGQPREYIDPATLEKAFVNYDVTLPGEARRYAWNGARILAGFGRNLGWLLALPIFVGVASLVRERRFRYLSGAMSFLVYLLLLAVFEVKERYLQLTLPSLSILAAHGLTRLLESAQASRSVWRSRLATAVAMVVILGIVVQTAQAVRENLDDRSGSALLRNAAIQLGSLRSPSGIVYEQWGVVGFHAHYQTRTLTPNDLETILRYIDKHEPPGTPVYLALSSMESYAYHQSVRALLDSGEGVPRLQRRIFLSDEDGRVVVYEVRTSSGAVPRE